MPRVTHFEIYTDDPEAVQPFTGIFLTGSSRNSPVARLSTGLSRQATTRSPESTVASLVREKGKAPPR